MLLEINAEVVPRAATTMVIKANTTKSVPSTVTTRTTATTTTRITATQTTATTNTRTLPAADKVHSETNMLSTESNRCCHDDIAAVAAPTNANVSSNSRSDSCDQATVRSSSNSWKQRWGLVLLLLFFSTCDLAEAALRNVNLYVEPPAVRRGQSVTLRCQHELEGAPLYSVKFYRGQLEFFRYTPGEFPSTKIFHYPGINVDEHASNASQVVIRNVGFSLSGNFSCEVTADAPLFSTAYAYATMQVVEFPEKRPQLFTEHNRYEPGDILRANCSTPPSRPRAELRFTINNVVVSSGETQYIRTVDNLIASRISLKLQLQGIHFGPAAPLPGTANPHMMNGLGGDRTSGGFYGRQALGGGGGGLVLRCTAQIGDLYQEYKEMQLGTPQRDPVPARVTLSSGSGLKSFFDSYFSASSASTITKTTTTMRTRTTVLHTQLLTISIAAGVIGAFHWLQLCGCR